MNKTKNIMLLGLLVLQIAVLAFLYRPGQHAAPVAGNLFKALAPEQVTSLSITGEGGKAIALTKKDGWQIDPGGFPADQSKIEALIKKLAELKAVRLVSQTTSSHARLKVAAGDFNRKVELGQVDAMTTFFLGTSPSAKSIHLRLSDAKEVYQINDLAAWEVQAEKESWWQTKYLSLKQDTLTGLRITNGSGALELAYDADKKAWQLKTAPETALDGKQVDTLVTPLLAIDIDSYQAKDFAPPKGKPLATVTYQTKEGEKTLEIWAKDKAEDGNQVVKASSSAFYAKAKDYVVKGILEAKQDSLIAKDKAEAKETEASPPPTN